MIKSVHERRAVEREEAEADDFFPSDTWKRVDVVLSVILVFRTASLCRMDMSSFFMRSVRFKQCWWTWDEELRGQFTEGEDDKG